MQSSRLYNTLVLFGPSGSGKSTLLKNLLAEFPNIFGYSISHTTRQPRLGEIDGKDYHFISKAEMLAKIEDNMFIETAEYSGNLYGTSKFAIESVISENKICLLDIDMVGVEKLKSLSFHPFIIFIRPPSIKVLEERLRKRGSDPECSIQKRLEIAERELEYASKAEHVNYVIVNDNLQEAYSKLRKVVLQCVLNKKDTE
ncbi:guanylate kinase-like [Zophobas morio]|uniref:guanylate kinase-like n=1 Tax=Zophobas morio TaxID=2755281 RepID=UPI003083CC40